MSDVRKADILSHCSSQITASNGSKRVSSISATTNALTKPLKILFTVRFTFSCAKKKWWSADAVGQRGDRTEVRRTDTSDCSSMTIHEGWTNLQGLALPISDESFRRCDKISLLSDFRSGLKFPFTVQAALGWELSAGRTQSVPVPETVVTGLSEPIFAARSPIQKGKSRVEFQADRHKVPMRTSHWWGEPQSQQDLTWSNVNNRCNSHTTSN